MIFERRVHWSVVNVDRSWCTSRSMGRGYSTPRVCNEQRERERVLQQGGGAVCFLSWGRGQWKGWCQSQEQWTIDDADFEIEQVDSESSVGPCPQPDTSSVDTADSCLVSLSLRSSSSRACIAVSPTIPKRTRRRKAWQVVRDDARRTSTLTSLSCPCRRKKDLHETQERTLKLFPRAVSPHTKQMKGRLGSRPAVSFFRPMVAFHKVKESAGASSSSFLVVGCVCSS